MKYLRRIVWFFANRLLVLCLILGLIMTVFYYTMNLSNIQIVLNDFGYECCAVCFFKPKRLDDTLITVHFCCILQSSIFS